MQQQMASDEEDYVPSVKEIHGYAEFLGMDPEVDKEFLYIAVEGLKAPVPHPWQIVYDENEEIQYVNQETGERLVDHPLDDYYKQLFLKAKADKGNTSTG